MAVVGGEEEVAFAHKDIGSTGEHLRMVAIAKLREQDANCLGTFSLKQARHHGGLVVKLARGGSNTLACRLRDGTVRGVVQNEGNGCRTEVKVLGQHLQADGTAGF